MTSNTLSYPLKISLGTFFISLWVLLSPITTQAYTGTTGWTYLFGNSSNIDGYYGLQNITQTHTTNGVTISGTYARNSGSNANYPPSIEIETSTTTYSVSMVYPLFQTGLENAVYDFEVLITNTGIKERYRKQGFSWLSYSDTSLTAIPSDAKYSITNTFPQYDLMGTTTSYFVDIAQENIFTTQIPQQPTATQYITITTPEYGTTTGNTPDINIHFQTPITIDFRPTTTRTIVIRDAVTLVEEWREEEVIPANSGENVNINTTTYLSNGSKLIFAFYAKEDGSIYSETAQSFFNVNTNTYQIATGLVTPNSTPTETQNDCSTFDVGCQFQKALMFLFYPSQAVLDRFSSLWQNISTKKPFGYVTMTIDALTNLDTESAHAFDIGEVPFQTAIFDPFKIALGSILWAVYAIYFYQRRLKHLDI